MQCLENRLLKTWSDWNARTTAQLTLDFGGVQRGPVIQLEVLVGILTIGLMLGVDPVRPNEGARSCVVPLVEVHVARNLALSSIHTLNSYIHYSIPALPC